MTLSDPGVGVCVSSSTASTNKRTTAPASIPAIHSQEQQYNARAVPAPPMERCASNASNFSFNNDICRICHCEGDADTPLIAPCYCAGSLRYVHQSCLQQWIKSSDTKSCELCKFNFIMHSKIKPFNKWERLDMSGMEQRKIACSVTFHVVAITCVVWSLYVLIERTTEEVQEGTLEWPFWTKLIVVAIGFTGGLVFMYVQCKMYVQLCRRWRAFNRVIYVQNAPEKVPLSERDRMELQRDPGPQMGMKEACSEPQESDKSLMGVSIITGTSSHHDLINPSTTTTTTTTPTCPHTLTSGTPYSAALDPHTLTSTPPFSAPCSHTLISTHTSTSAPTCPHILTSGTPFSAACPHTLTSTHNSTPFSTSASTTTTTTPTPPGAVWTDTQPGFTGVLSGMRPSRTPHQATEFLTKGPTSESRPPTDLRSTFETTYVYEGKCNHGSMEELSSQALAHGERQPFRKSSSHSMCLEKGVVERGGERGLVERSLVERGVERSLVGGGPAPHPEPYFDNCGGGIRDAHSTFKRGETMRVEPRMIHTPSLNLQCRTEGGVDAHEVETLHLDNM